MGLHNPPASVLTHGGRSKDATLSALSTAADHNEDQMDAMFAGYDEDAGDSPTDSKFPMHVHSTEHLGDFKEVADAEELKAALEYGWSETPIEIVKGDKK